MAPLPSISHNSKDKGLRNKFIIIGSLVFVLPALFLLYLFYQKNVPLDNYNLIFFALILLLILAGLIILRSVFDRIFSFSRSLKESTESGGLIASNLKKDVTELNEISDAFNELLAKFQQVTEQASQKALELNAIKDIAEIAMKKSDPEELLDRVLDKALGVTNAQRGSSFIVDLQSGRLRLIGARGIQDLEKGSYINIDDSLIKHVITEKKPLLVMDIENDPRTRRKNDPKYGSPSFLIMPIYTGQRDDVTAVLSLSHKKTGEHFDANDENILSLMLFEISFSLENAVLHTKLAEYIKDIEDRNVRLEKEITIRKQIETSLRNSEARFRELADLLPQTVFEIDLRGNLLFANRAAFKSFGYSQDHFNRGLNALHMFIPEDRDRLRSDTQRILNGEYIEGVEYTALKMDGTPFPVVIYSSPIVHDDIPVGLRGIVIDITERKKAEETQKKLQDNLMQAEKLAAVGTCAAGIAHEVKNPLAVIIQGVEYLKTRTGSDPLLMKVSEKIKKSALRADTIVKGLLSFTRQMPIRTEEAEITHLIEESLSFIEYQLESMHIKVVRQYSPDIPMIRVDHNQMKQIFVNVLLNSVEAMKDGGTITISTELLTKEPDQRFLQIVFSDNGCGIPEDKIQKVFDPFFTTKNAPENTGLGLSITKGIIDKHHGTIHIESEAQKGTSVIICLPLADSHA